MNRETAGHRLDRNTLHTISFVLEKSFHFPCEYLNKSTYKYTLHYTYSILHTAYTLTSGIVENEISLA